tara:strand:- start:434 stop:1783 length:1350 start_codon:yes stop_codon:yes gene_type:complete
MAKRPPSQGALDFLADEFSEEERWRKPLRKGQRWPKARKTHREYIAKRDAVRAARREKQKAEQQAEQKTRDVNFLAGMASERRRKRTMMPDTFDDYEGQFEIPSGQFVTQLNQETREHDLKKEYYCNPNSKEIFTTGAFKKIPKNFGTYNDSQETDNPNQTGENMWFFLQELDQDWLDDYRRKYNPDPNYGINFGAEYRSEWDAEKKDFVSVMTKQSEKPKWAFGLQAPQMPMDAPPRPRDGFCELCGKHFNDHIEGPQEKLTTKGVRMWGGQFPGSGEPVAQFGGYNKVKDLPVLTSMETAVEATEYQLGTRLDVPGHLQVIDLDDYVNKTGVVDEGEYLLEIINPKWADYLSPEDVALLSPQDKKYRIVSGAAIKAGREDEDGVVLTYREMVEKFRLPEARLFKEHSGTGGPQPAGFKEDTGVPKQSKPYDDDTGMMDSENEYFDIS